MRNDIKNDLYKDREEYYQTKFYNSEVSTASIWATVNDLLGTSSNSYSSAPSMICYQGQVYTKPKSIYNALNQIFINKVKNLRNNTANFVHGAASERLRSWLRRRETDISNFVLQPICIQKLRKILKKLKGNRSCGNDFIDGFSIKMAAPIIEDILLHIVNLSINESKYPQF